MRNLLHANFSRLLQSKVFWACTGVLMAVALGFMLLETTEVYTVKLEKAIFQCLSVYGVVTAVFVSLFLGAEYGDGTMRNKIVIGVRRETVYLSGFVTAAAGCVFMYGAAMLIAGIAGVCLFEPGLPAVKILAGLGLGLLTGVSYAGIYCLIAMVCHNKALTAVCCLVLSLMLLFLSVFVNFRLAQPEMVETLGGIKVTGEMELTVDDGNRPELETVPNPYYVSGVRRQIYSGLQNINPAGQAAAITAVSYGRPGPMAASSVFISMLCCLGGVWLFRRKDIQ